MRLTWLLSAADYCRDCREWDLALERFQYLESFYQDRQFIEWEPQLRVTSVKGLIECYGKVAESKINKKLLYQLEQEVNITDAMVVN